MIVADYKKGLLLFDPKENSIKPFMARHVPPFPHTSGMA
jgi:hypothetical protein